MSSSMMNTDVYDALIAAGAPEDKARAAAKSIGDTSQLATKADLETAIAKLEGRIGKVEWMLGFNLALTAAVLLALIFK